MEDTVILVKIADADNMIVIVIVRVVTADEMVLETVPEMVVPETVVVMVDRIDMETTIVVVKTEAIITVKNQHQHQFTVNFSLKKYAQINNFQ